MKILHEIVIFNLLFILLIENMIFEQIPHFKNDHLVLLFSLVEIFNKKVFLSIYILFLLSIF